MTVSNITFQTIQLNSACLALTSGFGMLLYVFVFSVIFSPIAKSTEASSSNNRTSPTDGVFFSFGLNDCVSLICWLITAIRASIKEITVSNILIDITAYVSTASRICKRYHLLALILTRLVALRFNQKQESWLSVKKLAAALLSIWIVSYVITAPILASPRIDYNIREFTFYVNNEQAKMFFFAEEVITTVTFTSMASLICVWMIKKYVSYRKAHADTDNNGVFIITGTAEVARFIQETRKSITTMILIGFYFLSEICYLALIGGETKNETKNNDELYLVKYFFRVYMWCLNCAAPPTVFIIVEQTLQKIFARFFEKKNRVTPLQGSDIHLPGEGHLSHSHSHNHLHVDAERGSAIVVFPMQDLGDRPTTSQQVKVKYQGTAASIT